MKTYSVVIQASPEEILNASKRDDLNIQSLLDWPSIEDVIVIIPPIEDSERAIAKLDEWNIKFYIGDTYNICKRIINAHNKFFPLQNFAVRMLAIWKHVDLEYIDKLVMDMLNNHYDMVATPKDFDFTMAADIASIDVLKKIATLSNSSQETTRAHFNPWGYIETNSKKFNIKHLEPAPIYNDEQIKKILSNQRCHPENEFFGRDYAGSRYHYIAEKHHISGRVLDIACGSGFGSKLLSEKANFVLGVDYLENSISIAKQRYPENRKLKFMVGNGENFLYQEKENQFDTIVSLHTLEHVPNDKAMLNTLIKNLKPGGQLIAEVPLVFKRPIGKPINPYHFREYTKEAFISMVEDAGLEIKEFIGANRSFYGDWDQARDAIQIRAIKR